MTALSTLRGHGNLNGYFRLSINFYRFRIDKQLSGVTQRNCARKAQKMRRNGAQTLGLAEFSAPV